MVDILILVLQNWESEAWRQWHPPISPPALLYLLVPLQFGPMDCGPESHACHPGPSNAKMAHDSSGISSFMAATRKAPRRGDPYEPVSWVKVWFISPIDMLCDK